VCLWMGKIKWKCGSEGCEDETRTILLLCMQGRDRTSLDRTEELFCRLPEMSFYEQRCRYQPSICGYVQEEDEGRPIHLKIAIMGNNDYTIKDES
jgi:hypothetical protein